MAAETTRINLLVGEDVPDKLTLLAGGERKRGEYLTQLIRAIHEGEQQPRAGGDLEQLRLAFQGLAGRQRELEGRLLQVERELAAVIAGAAGQ